MDNFQVFGLEKSECFAAVSLGTDGRINSLDLNEFLARVQKHHTKDGKPVDYVLYLLENQGKKILAVSLDTD